MGTHNLQAKLPKNTYTIRHSAAHLSIISSQKNSIRRIINKRINYTIILHYIAMQLTTTLCNIIIKSNNW